MRVLRYLTTLVFAGALVHAAPTSYSASNTQGVSQDLDSLFQYISTQNNGAGIPEKQQIQQDLGSLQTSTDKSSQVYKIAVENFWHQLGQLWVKYPYWSGWSHLLSDVQKDGWTPSENSHSNDASATNYSPPADQFDHDLDELEIYVKQYDIGSLGDVLIVKQAVAWLKANEHNIDTVHDYNDQATKLDAAWGRLQKNNAAWSKWDVTDNDFKSIYSDSLKDVPSSSLSHLYATEISSHNDGVNYEDLGSFFGSTSHNDSTTDDVSDTINIEEELDAIFAALSMPKNINHVDALADFVNNLNLHDSI